MSETTVNYDNEADILRVQFIPTPEGNYVHYWDKYFATIHDEITDKVVGLHIEAWAKFKTEMVADAKQMRAYIPTAVEPTRSIPVTLNPPKVRPSFVIDPDDYD